MEDEAFSLRYADYLRLDVKFGFPPEQREGAG